MAVSLFIPLPFFCHTLSRLFLSQSFDFLSLSVAFEDILLSLCHSLALSLALSLSMAATLWLSLSLSLSVSVSLSLSLWLCGGYTILKASSTKSTITAKYKTPLNWI